MLTESSNALSISRNGTELSRLINAAVVSPAFCKQLLTNPEAALATGYNGEIFQLASEERERVASIRATSLIDFALKLSNRQNGKGIVDELPAGSEG